MIEMFAIIRRKVAILGLFVLGASGLSYICPLLCPAEMAQAEEKLSKEERLNRLKIEEAELSLEQAATALESYKREYESTKELFDKRAVTLKEVNEAQRSYEEALLACEEAKIELEKTKLDLLRNATHISILEAKKYNTLDGKRMAQITLQNTSNISQAMTASKDLSRSEIAALLRIQNIIVSLEEGAIVAEPYEIIIPSLKLGQKKTLTFKLLRDPQKVGVRMRFLDTEHLTQIVLKKEALHDVPTINSAQFSQEGDQGSRVRFDILLERLAEEERSFRLVVINLPHELKYAFVDPLTEARLTQVKFTEETPKQRLNLVITIPEKLRRDLIDRTIKFYVFVTEASEFKTINTLRKKYGDKPIELKDIVHIKGNKVALELIPRGVGELEVVISNRYQEIKMDQDVTIRVDIRNKGTLAVQNVKAVVDPPYEWQAEVTPSLVKEIRPGEKAPVDIKVLLPQDLSVGEYDVQVEAQGEVGNEKVESIEKSITIRVGARSHVLGNIALVGGLVVLVIGIAVVSIRISRR